MPSQTNRRRRTLPPPAVFALVLIPLLVESVVVLVPAFQGVQLSFTRWDGFSASENVGLANYVNLASDEVFLQSLRNTVVWLLVFGGVSLVAGLGMALLLQSDRRGVAIYRTALFLPVVFSLVVTALIWNSILQPSGLLNKVLEVLGLGALATPWLGDPNTALFAVIAAALWRQIGYIMVLYIAGLKAIDPTLLEAGRMDGASTFQRFRFITLPQLRGVNLVIISVLVIDSLRSFDVVWALTRGGPFHSTELLSTYMFSQAFQSRSLGYASAIAVVIFVLAIGVIISYLVRAFADEKES